MVSLQSTMTVLQWKDGGALTDAQNLSLKRYILRHKAGLTPLHGKEKRLLREYAQSQGLSEKLVYSFRNAIRITEEMSLGDRAESVEELEYRLEDVVSHPATQHRTLVRRLLRTLPSRFSKALDVWRSSSSWSDLSPPAQTYLLRLREMENPQESAQRAADYEERLGECWKEMGLEYTSEAEMREEKPNAPTPDYYFPEGITYRKDGRDYQIFWIDAKNYYLSRTSFPERGLKKQAGKYKDAYGLGLYVSSVGYDQSLRINGALLSDSVCLLDG